MEAEKMGNKEQIAMSRHRVNTGDFALYRGCGGPRLIESEGQLIPQMSYCQRCLQWACEYQKWKKVLIGELCFYIMWMAQWCMCVFLLVHQDALWEFNLWSHKDLQDLKDTVCFWHQRVLSEVVWTRQVRIFGRRGGPKWYEPDCFNVEAD